MEEEKAKPERRLEGSHAAVGGEPVGDCVTRTKGGRVWSSVYSLPRSSEVKTENTHWFGHISHQYQSGFCSDWSQSRAGSGGEGRGREATLVKGRFEGELGLEGLNALGGSGVEEPFMFLLENLDTAKVLRESQKSKRVKRWWQGKHPKRQVENLVVLRET